MKPTDPVISMNAEEFEALVQRVGTNSLSESDRSVLVTILRTFQFIQAALEQKKVALSKLKELLFGKRTEKDLKDKKVKPAEELCPSAAPASNSGEGEKSDTSIENEILDQLEPPPEAGTKPSVPGHGRRPAHTWKNATHVYHCHDCYEAGQLCPKCEKGKLYPYDKPSIFARITGQSPLAVEVHHGERLRCNQCGELFTAPLPKEVNDFPVATAEANAVAAVTKYQAATPFNRFSNVLKGYGVAVPPSRLYSMAACVSEDALPVFSALCRLAAQGTLFQNDDTRVIVLTLLKENKAAEAAGTELERKGMFTTGILAQVGPHRIALYFTGRNHAGENLADILKERVQGLPPPTQVSDRLAANVPRGYGVDDGGCLDHLRREFYDIRKFFPTRCAYALDQLALVYRADAIAKNKKMTSARRLKLHQEVSLPVMERLKGWGQKELDEKRVEPNSPLGSAIKYLIKHYPALTLFTRKEDVPIANSDCEQMLKTPIAVRKMAYFYKTLEGAAVASVILSLIHTCTYAEETVFDYLVAIQKNSADVRKNAELWLPWNYRERMNSLPNTG